MANAYTSSTYLPDSNKNVDLQIKASNKIVKDTYFTSLDKD